MIYQLVYVSEYTGHSPQSDLHDILAASRRFNPQHNITGLLLFIGGSFIQVLEGDDEAKVRALYERIALDSRHGRLDILLDHTIPQRLFPEWSMAWMPISETEFCALAHIQRCDFATLSQLDNNIVSNILLNFAEAKLDG